MRRRSEFTTPYKGTPTGWGAWLAHRITGVGILLFLFAHIVDTATVAWGPETYDSVIELYKNPFVMMMELGLVGAVIYHALNGLRVMIIDFWPQASARHRELFWGTMALFGAAMAPITWIMGRRIIEDLFG